MNKKEIEKMKKEVEELRKIGIQKNKPHWDNVCEVIYYKHNDWAILPIDEDYYAEKATSYSISLEYGKPDAEFKQKFYFVKIVLK